MSDDQFTQLAQAIQAMDKKFEKKFEAMDDRFDVMEKKFDNQFTGLYKYTTKEFNKVHKRLDKTATKNELNTYVNAVDTFAKRTETYHDEVLALGHKVDRHERWHEQTAKAAGINLTA